MVVSYPPEGRLLHTPGNQAACQSLHTLAQAQVKQTILEGRTILCTPGHDLQVQLGPFTGVIPREDPRRYDSRNCYPFPRGETNDVYGLLRPVRRHTTSLPQAGSGTRLGSAFGSASRYCSTGHHNASGLLWSLCRHRMRGNIHASDCTLFCRTHFPSSTAFFHWSRDFCCAGRKGPKNKPYHAVPQGTAGDLE